MGTYTTNKNLFMPTVGEQGWGTLVNGNFSTIDTFLKPISLSGSTYTFTGNHVGNQSGGSISATSISNSGNMTNTGTLTCTGKITSSNVIQCQKVYVNGRVITTKMSNYSPTYASVAAQSVSATASSTNNQVTTSTLTVAGYTIKSISYPVRVGPSIYVPAAANVTSIPSIPSSVSRTVTISVSDYAAYANSTSVGRLYVNGTQVSSVSATYGSTKTATYTVTNGDTVYGFIASGGGGSVTVSIAAATTVYYIDGI